MRVLVTGADGFVGEHVLRRLLDAGAEVVGGIRTAQPLLRTLSDAQAGSIRWMRFELGDEDSVRQLVRGAAPDAVIHLAGLSSVSRSWREPRRTFETNALGALTLADALRTWARARDSRIMLLLVGSAEAYGRSAADGHRLSEADALQPISPYAASKAAQEMVGFSFGSDPALGVVQTRSFQHIGAGQRPPFVFAEWAEEILRAGTPGQPLELSVGDTSIERDILDVRDVADAYVRLLDASEAGVYNVCSGSKYRLADALPILGRLTGVEVVPVSDEGRRRPADIACLWGSPERLTAATGWQPRYSLAQALEALVDDLRRHGSAGPA